MTKLFDEAVKNILSKEIERAKKRRLKLYRKMAGKIRDKAKTPNTPGNTPVHQQSPATLKGINKDFADTPMPLGIGV